MLCLFSAWNVCPCLFHLDNASLSPPASGEGFSFAEEPLLRVLSSLCSRPFKCHVHSRSSQPFLKIILPCLHTIKGSRNTATNFLKPTPLLACIYVCLHWKYEFPCFMPLLSIPEPPIYAQSPSRKQEYECDTTMSQLWVFHQWAIINIGFVLVSFLEPSQNTWKLQLIYKEKKSLF